MNRSSKSPAGGLQNGTLEICSEGSQRINRTYPTLPHMLQLLQSTMRDPTFTALYVVAASAPNFEARWGLTASNIPSWVAAANGQAARLILGSHGMHPSAPILPNPHPPVAARASMRMLIVRAKAAKRMMMMMMMIETRNGNHNERAGKSSPTP